MYVHHVCSFSSPVPCWDCRYEDMSSLPLSSPQPHTAGRQMYPECPALLHYLSPSFLPSLPLPLFSNLFHYLSPSFFPLSLSLSSLLKIPTFLHYIIFLPPSLPHMIQNSKQSMLFFNTLHYYTCIHTALIAVLYSLRGSSERTR